MSYNKFPNGAFVEYKGARYIPRGYTFGRINLIHEITGQPLLYAQPGEPTQLPTDGQFENLLDSGDIIIKSRRDPRAMANHNSINELTRDQAIRTSPDVLRKMEACRICDEHGVPSGEKAIASALNRHWKSEYGPRPPASSVRVWMRERGTPGDRHPRHMMRRAISHENPTGTSCIGNGVLWKCVLDGRKAGRNVPDIHADYAREIHLINSGAHPTIDQPATPLKTKSQRTVRRRFDALESDLTLANIIEKEATEQDWLGAGKPMTADHVMQFVIIDHTQVDVHVVCPILEMVLGRPWLTIAIDVKSRAIVGHLISFNDPCSWSVSEILRRIVLPKRPPPEMLKRYPVLSSLRGKPDCLVLDNAVEFRSHNLEAAARDAGLSVRFCPVGKPRYRAICERAIGTLNRQICRALPGRVLTINDVRRFKYNAEKMSVVMTDELEAVVNQIVACYNVEPHEGLFGRQPALIFEKYINRFGINNFADIDDFFRDVMEVKQGAQLSPSGIRAFNLRYHDVQAVPQLLRDLVPIEPRRQRRDDATATVEFRYDSMDISRIHVWNRKTRKYVELRCADEQYSDGMPMWLHDKIRQSAQSDGLAFNTEQERLIARGALINAVKNIDPRELTESRKRLAELLEIPRIRQITGNIIETARDFPMPGNLGDFISNDRAALNSIDVEILSPRPAPRTKAEKPSVQQRRENASKAQQIIDTPVRGRRLIADKGGYK